MADAKGWRRLGRQPVGIRLGLVGLVAVLGALASAPWGWWTRQVDGVSAACWAWLIAGIGGGLALAIVEPFRGPNFALAHVSLGGLARLGTSLAGLMVVVTRHERLLRAGFVYYLLVAYMASLAIDVGIALAVAANDDQRRRDASEI